jgi:N-ethylmaleimide reductase
MVTPRALETGELPGIVEQFRRAAENAREAGFDGVELHGSNGYLLDQFLRDGSNQRTDAYGGSIENRARLPLEVARAVVGVWGAERVGYRLSPQPFPYAGMTDSTPAETFTSMARELNRLGLGYLHVTEAVSGKAVPSEEQRITPLLRKVFQGTLIVNGGYDARTGEAALSRREAELVAYGVPFLANPDLPKRFQREAPLNPPDFSTFYSGEEKGYTDYPALR